MLPNRVFDIIDIAFNSLAATVIIGARWALALRGVGYTVDGVANRFFCAGADIPQG